MMRKVSKRSVKVVLLLILIVSIVPSFGAFAINQDEVPLYSQENTEILQNEDVDDTLDELYK